MVLTLNLNTLPRENVTLDARGEPPFATYTPDYQLLYSFAGKYAATTNFVVVGRDAAAFRALYAALAAYRTTKRVVILETLDPDHVAHARQRCRPDDTLVVVTGHGDDPESAQAVLAFPEYKKLLLVDGQLLQHAQLRELDHARYPGGLGPFVVGSEAALLAAAIIYIDVKSVVGGMQSVYRQCDPSRPLAQNPALQLASALLAAEKLGFHEVNVPIFNHAVAGGGLFFSGLMRCCGQPFCVREAGERPNGITLFLRVERPEHDVELAAERTAASPLAAAAGLRLGDLATRRYEESRRALDAAHVPNATLSLDVLNPGTLGELLGFWQYLALYGAWLRGYDPFQEKR